jgi:GMP synthase-like glutamine amidotransferase
MLLIATAFGGKTTQLPDRHFGLRRIALTHSGSNYLELAPNEMVYENHSVVLSESPKNFDILANSEDCIAIIKHQTLPIVGVQFHPEQAQEHARADTMWRAILDLLW